MVPRYLIKYNGLGVELHTNPHDLAARANPDDFLLFLKFKSWQNESKVTVDLLVTAYPRARALGQQCMDIWTFMLSGKTSHLAPT